MLEDALSRGFRAMVLTNAMKPMDKMKPALLRLRERFSNRLTLRVSIDHYGCAVHELERGRRSWAPTIDGLVWLAENGFSINVASRMRPSMCRRQPRHAGAFSANRRRA